MTHYHVISSKGLRTAIASATFDSYEESLFVYVRLSTEFFSNIVGASALSIENARKATANGKAHGAFCGTDDFAFVWMRCSGTCVSGTWN